MWYMQAGYRGVSLPKGLVDAVEDYVKTSGGKYKSIAQFVAEASRLRLERLAKPQEAPVAPQQ